MAVKGQQPILEDERRRPTRPHFLQTPFLFDYHVGTREQRRRKFEAQRLRGLEIDRQLVLGWRLHRQIGRLLALEDTIDVTSREPELIDKISPIGDQAATIDKP